MMFSTLRSRLWLGYTILIVIILISFTIGLTITLSRSPILYRSSLLQLRLTELTIQRAVNLDRDNPVDALKTELDKNPVFSNMRVIVLDSRADTLFDSKAGQSVSIRWLTLVGIRRTEKLENTGTIRDSEGKAWLYVGYKLENGDYLVVTTPRENLSLKIMFSDPMLRLIAQILFLAIVVSLIMGIIMDSWLAKPLRNMANSARSLAMEEHEDIPVEGAKEIKVLATSLNEMSKQLKEVQQSQKNFISDVSHELKTPLTSIQGFSRAISDGTASDKKAVKHAAEVIFSESERMLRLVMDLLTLTRLEGGVEKLNMASVNMHEIFKGVSERLAIVAAREEIDIRGDLASLPNIDADPDKMIQVMTNLMENAIQHSPHAGTVHIDGDISDDSIFIHVRDSGKGISLSDQSRIFNRFFQADKSRSSAGTRSAGLGLPIALEIAHAHGGNIKVASELGKGSVFTLILPVNNPLVQLKEKRR